MVLKTPKKREPENKGPLIQAVVPQGPGKRPEAQIQTPTGGSRFVRLEESGLPRSDIERRVIEAKAQDEQARIQEELIQKGLNPLVNAVPQPESTQPLPQPQISPTGQETMNETGIKTQMPGEQPVKDILGTRLPAEQQTIPTREEIRAQTGLVALGLAGTASFLSNIARKASLNTPAEVANYAKYIPKEKVTGGLTKLGQVGSNIKNAGLFKQLIGAGVALFSVREIITAVLDDPHSSVAYGRVYDRLSTDIISTQKAFEEETDPLIKEAYAQELDNILEIQREFTDEDTWKGIKFKVPISKQIAVNNILSRARLAADDVRTRNAQRAIDAYKLKQIKAGQIEKLSPEARDYLKRLSEAKKESLQLAGG